MLSYFNKVAASRRLNNILQLIEAVEKQASPGLPDRIFLKFKSADYLQFLTVTFLGSLLKYVFLIFVSDFQTIHTENVPFFSEWLFGGEGMVF